MEESSLFISSERIWGCWSSVLFAEPKSILTGLGLSAEPHLHCLPFIQGHLCYLGPGAGPWAGTPIGGARVLLALRFHDSVPGSPRLALWLKPWTGISKRLKLHLEWKMSFHVIIIQNHSKSTKYLRIFLWGLRTPKSAIMSCSLQNLYIPPPGYH